MTEPVETRGDQAERDARRRYNDDGAADVLAITPGTTMQGRPVPLDSDGDGKIT